MHRLPLSAVIAGVALASRAPAQMPAAALASPDSAVRGFVVAALVRVLAENVSRAVTDTTHQPWRVFPDDTGRVWARERAGLERVLRARSPRADDQFAATLLIPRLIVRGDSTRARLNVVYHRHCTGGWTSRGTEYELVVAPRRAGWPIAGPDVTTMWDGASCGDVARYPGMGEPAPLDVGATSVPHAP